MVDDLYSRVVGWLKVLLPMGALMLLSTLFLFARGSSGSGEIPYAEIADIAREARISDPRLAGVTVNGDAIEVTARRIAPEPDLPDSFRVYDLQARITAAGGESVGLSAAEGALNGRERTVTLTGLARVETSSGYMVETRGLTADLEAGIVQTAGALEIRAPSGRLTAAALRVESGPEGQRLVFSGGVRLLYDPAD
jgi:lipopolysaccharide export system protein LptC